MTSFLDSPAIALFLLGFLVVEGLGLAFVWQKSQRGLPPGQIISFLGAGLGFAAALFVVMAELSSLYLAIALLIAFIFHVCDIVQRWQR
ncbi:hypothetical protein ACFQ14_15630 [Pseudahrensia aquimaris]|uniref:Uncharacterized protein n=1 Tax=Pseudahrensia aquimaris TaxID=744461 RepID=A0ABW3FKQ2_9HYPH